jgi:protein gp37
MSENSNINWTDATWNPVTGCTKVSAGCKHCYAEKMTRRLQAMGQAKYTNGFQVTLHPELLEKPFEWKKPRRIFVNSMSDLFHDEVPTKFIQDVFRVMREAKQHQFQVLTKRSTKLAELAPSLTWAENIWMGVTIETKKYLYRIDHLLETPAAIKFISFEPLLGPVGIFNPKGIDWVIVGGESGTSARPMKKKWAREVRDKCIVCKVAFFFKQWGGHYKGEAGCLLDGQIWNEYPA